MVPVSKTNESPKREKGGLKSYGRQNEGKTIKSLSLDKELVKVAEARAKELGVSFSQFVNDLLKASPPPTKKGRNR